MPAKRAFSAVFAVVILLENLWWCSPPEMNVLIGLAALCGADEANGVTGEGAFGSKRLGEPDSGVDRVGRVDATSTGAVAEGGLATFHLSGGLIATAEDLQPIVRVVVARLLRSNAGHVRLAHEHEDVKRRTRARAPARA